MSVIQIPGLVDVHVHLREPGATQKEDFTTGTMAAIAGGYTQVVDMPNNNPATTSEKALDDKIKLATNRVYCDLGFNFGATKDSLKYFKKIQKKVFGLKLYMNKTTGPLLTEEANEREIIFKSWAGDQPIMVHAMGETIEIAINLARKYKRKLHVCHVTTDQIPSIKKAKRESIRISSEVCPHHLFLNNNNLTKLGPLGMMQPPLMSRVDQEKIWDNLDAIDMISTDHAPHTLNEKNDKSDPKFGVPGLETTLPLMLSAVVDKKITQKRLVEMLATNPRKIFNIPEQENTFVQIDLSKKFKIGTKKLFTKCGWTPFKNFDGVGEIDQVNLRGEKIFGNGTFIGRPQGKIIYPKT